MSELLQRSTRSAEDVASAIVQTLVEGSTKHYRLFRQISHEAKGRAPFLEHHADLLEPDFWNETKARIAADHEVAGTVQSQATAIGACRH